LQRIAFNQNFARRRRPCARLRLQRADANVAIIFHHKQHQGAPIHWASFDATGHCSARFDFTDARMRGGSLKQSIVNFIGRYGE